MESQQCEGEKLCDDIDRFVNAKHCVENFKICWKCHEEAPSSRQTCRSCKGKLEKQNIASDDRVFQPIDPYHHFGIEPRQNSIEVNVGEPDMLNPNGFENISKIMQSRKACKNKEVYVRRTRTRA